MRKSSFNPADHLIQIKDGAYLPVAARVEWANTWAEENGKAIRFDSADSIVFQQIPMANGMMNTFAVVTCKVYIDDQLAATAEGSKCYISLNAFGELEHDDNFIDTASTKAKGRALANLGFSSTLEAAEKVLCDTPVSASVPAEMPADAPVKSVDMPTAKPAESEPVKAVEVPTVATDSDLYKKASPTADAVDMAEKSEQLTQWAIAEKTPSESDVADALVFVCGWGKQTKGLSLESILQDEALGATTIRKIAGNGALIKRQGGAEMQHYAKVLIAAGKCD